MDIRRLRQELEDDLGALTKWDSRRKHLFALLDDWRDFDAAEKFLDERGFDYDDEKGEWTDPAQGYTVKLDSREL